MRSRELATEIARAVTERCAHTAAGGYCSQCVLEAAQMVLEVQLFGHPAGVHAVTCETPPCPSKCLCDCHGGGA